MLDLSSVLENDPSKTELFVFMDFLKTSDTYRVLNIASHLFKVDDNLFSDELLNK